MADDIIVEKIEQLWYQNPQTRAERTYNRLLERVYDKYINAPKGGLYRAYWLNLLSDAGMIDDHLTALLKMAAINKRAMKAVK